MWALRMLHLVKSCRVGIPSNSCGCLAVWFDSSVLIILRRNTAAAERASEHALFVLEFEIEFQRG